MQHDALMASARRLRWFVFGALVSVLAAFVLLVTPGSNGRIRSTEADGYSISALGHSGWLQLLRENGKVVVQLRHLREATSHALLVMAEPRTWDAQEAAPFAQQLAKAANGLLVLPKRDGRPDPERPQWIGTDGLLSLEKATQCLHHLLPETPWQGLAVLRSEAATGWQASTDWEVSTGWTASLLPDLPGPVQLLRANDQLEPLLSCDQGVLLARYDDLTVLSDPDLIANHGIVRGDNAALALALVAACSDHEVLLYDETCHGHRRDPSFWSELGRWPLVLVSVQLWLLLALVLWIAADRFGAPLPTPPALAAGKRFLIDNIVNLLDRRNSHGAALRRFVRLRVRHAAERLQAPRGLSEDACRAWLLQRLPDDGVRSELTRLLDVNPDPLSASAAIILARRVHHLTK